MNATLEATEKALTAIEEQLDTALEASQDATAVVVNNPLVLAAVAVVGISAGAYVGYSVAKKKLALKFEEDLDEEISKTRKFYQTLTKTDVTPESLVAAKGLPVSLGYIPEVPAQSEHDLVQQQESMEVAAGRLEQVEGRIVPEQGEELADVLGEAAQEVRSIFSGTIAEWDQASEEEKRDLNPDEPYILSKQEYMENEYDWPQETLTYYEEDDVLTDDRDMPITDMDGLVGDDNLTKFGYGSGDQNVVYIHSPAGTPMSFEVVRSKGAFAKEVAGFLEHSDDSRAPKKFRGYHE
jgi:hypothetical protein